MWAEEWQRDSTMRMGGPTNRYSVQLSHHGMQPGGRRTMPFSLLVDLGCMAPLRF